MEFSAVLRARTSCRAFTAEPVSPETITAILEAGCAAPSPLHQQPWSFTVITDSERITAIAAHSAAVRDRLAEASGQGWVAKYDPTFVGQAPVLIVVAANPKKIGLGAFLGETAAHVKAASACIQNMLLAITDLGLGSLWFTMYDRQELSQMVGMEDGLEIVGLLPVGVPAAPGKHLPRKPVEELTTYL